MSATPHTPDPHASPAPEDKNKKLLTPEQEKSIEQKVLGDKIEELDTDDIPKIVEVLKDPNGSFIDAYKGIARVLGRSKGSMKPEERKKFELEIRRVVAGAIEDNEAKIKGMIKDLNVRLKTPMDATKQEVLKNMVAAYQSLLNILEEDHVIELLNPDNHPAAEPVHEEAIEHRETASESKEREILDVEKIESIEDINKNEAVCRKLVTKYGQPPKPGVDKELFWKEDMAKKDKKPLSAEEVKKYENFMVFITSNKKILALIQNDASAIAHKLQEELKTNRNEEVMSERLREETTVLLDSLLEKSHGLAGFDKLGVTAKGSEALLLHTLRVQELPLAFDKLQNVIQLEIVPSIREGKEIFKQALDKDGKPMKIKLSEFLAAPERMGYGEDMVEQTHEVLFKIYRGIGADRGFNLATCRDFLIDAIKTRGGAPLKVGEKTMSQDEAKKMYTAFLIMKAEHLGEKEALQLLIAFKEKPPFVYDLRNTNNGWEVIGTRKEGVGVLEDFCLDGMIYNELKDKLEMRRGEFDKFIIKVAPHFEHMRNAIKKHKKGELEGIVTPSELAIFEKLMDIPLCMDKVGQAYKHALYNSEERDVPVMDKIQGPDRKKLDIMFVNIEEKLSRIAERLADERLDQELKEAGPQGWGQLWRVDKIACKWWKRNAAVAYRDKYIEDIKKRLKEDPKYRTELMRLERDQVKPDGKWSGATPAEGQREDLNGELDAIAERFGVSFASGDSESYLTGNETVEKLENEQIQADIKKLCVDYTNGAVDDSGFRQRMKGIIQQIQTLKGTNDEIIGFLEETTDKGSVSEHKEGLLDKLRAHKAGLVALDLDNMRINLGTAKNVDVKTQVKDLNWSDSMSRKMVEGLQKNKFLGRFVTPATIGIVGFGLANITAQIATSRTLRWSALALAPFTGPAMWGIAAGCITGGVFAAIRKNKETLYHKAQKERRDALEYRPDIDDKGLRPGQAEGGRFERRIESTLYQKVGANALTSGIDGAANYDALCTALGRAIAYNTISENERMDLIKYTDESHVESERLTLVRAISRGRARLRGLTRPTGERPGADHINDLDRARSTTESQIRAEVADAESKFKSFKRMENLKSAGIGALFGAGTAAALTGLGHLAGWSEQNVNSTTTSLKNLTPSGSVDKAALITTLKGSGLSNSEISRLAFDSHGNPTQATIDFLHTKHIDLKSIVTPGTTGTQSLVQPINFGTHMTQTEFIQQANIRGAGLGTSDFDARGHLLSSGIAKLQAHNIRFNEHVTSVVTPGPVTPGPVTPIQALNTQGFSRLGHIHFNGHTPKHILDELRLKWAGAPEVGADGNCHFSMKGMVDGGLTHTRMPSGVNLPSDPSQFKIGLEVHTNGHSYWKFFTPDSRGQVSIPKEYFTNSVGYVARGGSVLPGLRTHGMAVGFMDNHGTYQVLASVRGGGTYIPNPPTPTPIVSDVVNFSGEETIQSTITKPGSALYEASQQVEKVVTTTEAVASPPIVGAPMSHLEYGKKKVTPPPPPPQPPVVPPVVPQVVPPPEPEPYDYDDPYSGGTGETPRPPTPPVTPPEDDGYDPYVDNGDLPPRAPTATTSTVTAPPVGPKPTTVPVKPTTTAPVAPKPTTTAPATPAVPPVAPKPPVAPASDKGYGESDAGYDATGTAY
ncbi:MAG: hypothetical protein WC101_04555 [Candidatus Gracilibacteria bacterium]